MLTALPVPGSVLATTYPPTLPLPAPFAQSTLDYSSDDKRDPGEELIDNDNNSVHGDMPILPVPPQPLGLNPPMIPSTSSSNTVGAATLTTSDITSSSSGLIATSEASSSMQIDSETTNGAQQISGLRSSSSSSSSSSTVSFLPTTASESSVVVSTALPINQPHGGRDSGARHPSIGIAGTVLISIFGIIALLTALYLLCCLRRRQRILCAQSHDHEKQGVALSSTQETGVILGNSKSTRTRFTQKRYHQRLGTQRRSRLQCEGRRQSGSNTHSSHSRQQNMQLSAPIDTSINPSILHCPSPLFFTRYSAQARSSRTENSTKTAPTTRFSTSESRSSTIPSRQVDSITSTQVPFSLYRTGSGHARAYAHHGIHAPTRSATSSPASTRRQWRWTRQTIGTGNSQQSLPCPDTASRWSMKTKSSPVTTTSPVDAANRSNHHTK